jgi:hypothetical protein
MSPLAERIDRLRARIRMSCEASGRDPASVELLPVSKRQPLSLIREAAALGFERFGENYVQEGIQKVQETQGTPLQFVLIGPLQRNKAKPALVHFQEIMTVDRPELAERLRHLAAELDLVRGVWIQVDLWGEASKLGGCDEAGADEVFRALGQDPRLPLQGLMAIPPPEDAQAFRTLELRRDAWQQSWGQRLRLSMGMSSDLEAAIAAGTDQIRIGTAFFGER